MRAMSAEFPRICTNWQLEPDNLPNDHSDAAYDFKTLERLDRMQLHEDLLSAVGVDRADEARPE